MTDAAFQKRLHSALGAATTPRLRAYQQPGRDDCSLEGCDKACYCKGLCTRHYGKLRRHGSTDDRLGDSASLAVRIKRSVVIDEETGCWMWQGGLRGGGYGRLSVHDRSAPAHRVSFEVFRHPIPDGRVLDHLCRVRSCVNPWHLEVVTQHENTMRSPTAPSALNYLKTECKNGHPFTPENTYRRPTGGRSCRRCAALRMRRYASRKQLTAAPGR